MAAFAYEYRVKGLVKAPAQAVGELFEKLENSDTGLTPEAVLNASRDEGTLLHDEFEWNDAVAAEKHRLSQARFIIQNIAVITETDDREERKAQKDRAFVITPGRNSVYVALQSAMSNDEWRSHLLKLALDDMETFTAKYRRLTELANVFGEMEKAKKRCAATRKMPEASIQ